MMNLVSCLYLLELQACLNLPALFLGCLVFFEGVSSNVDRTFFKFIEVLAQSSEYWDYRQASSSPVFLALNHINYVANLVSSLSGGSGAIL